MGDRVLLRPLLYVEIRRIYRIAGNFRGNKISNFYICNLRKSSIFVTLAMATIIIII